MSKWRRDLKTKDINALRLNQVIHPVSVSGVRTSQNAISKTKSRRYQMHALWQRKTDNRQNDISLSKGMIAKKSKRSALWISLCALIWFVWTPLYSVSCSRSDDQPCAGNYRSSISSAWPWWQRNIILTNRDSITNELKKNEPYIASVEMKRWISGNIIFVVEERVTAALLQVIGENNKELYYLVSKDGKLLDEVNKEVVQSDLLTIIDQAQIELSPGASIIDPMIIAYATEVAKKQIQGYILEQVIVDQNPRQMTIKMVNAIDQRIDVLISTARPLDEQIVDMDLTLGYLSGQGIVPIYIDLRLKSATPYR